MPHATEKAVVAQYLCLFFFIGSNILYSCDGLAPQDIAHTATKQLLIAHGSLQCLAVDIDSRLQFRNRRSIVKLFDDLTRERKAREDMYFHAMISTSRKQWTRSLQRGCCKECKRFLNSIHTASEDDMLQWDCQAVTLFTWSRLLDDCTNSWIAFANKHSQSNK